MTWWRSARKGATQRDFPLFDSIPQRLVLLRPPHVLCFFLAGLAPGLSWVQGCTEIFNALDLGWAVSWAGAQSGLGSAWAELEPALGPGRARTQPALLPKEEKK